MHVLPPRVLISVRVAVADLDLAVYDLDQDYL